jgi:hypothetical protein
MSDTIPKGELIEVWCQAQYEGRTRELIALYGPTSPYVEMYEGGWESCDAPSKESYRRSATYIIDALERAGYVVVPSVEHDALGAEMESHVKEMIEILKERDDATQWETK